MGQTDVRGGDNEGFIAGFVAIMFILGEVINIDGW